MDDDPLLEVVLRGLGAPQKTLPPTLFYDAAGSLLFDRITRLEEYYPTRVEGQILRERGPEIASVASPGDEPVVVVEPGCGSGAKVAALLSHLHAIAYVGIDVSVTALRAGAARLLEAFPSLQVLEVEADFLEPLRLPPLPTVRRVGFFPGSTIGNFEPEDAVRFLARLRRMVGRAGSAVVGVDLWKDEPTLRAAYDDREGVTAAFDLNALAHLNRRYGADFRLDRFVHEARVDPVLRRVEMHLVARHAHAFHVAGRRFEIGAGESIHTESAYKYDVGAFSALAGRAGLRSSRHWTDEDRRFAVFALAAAP